MKFTDFEAKEEALMATGYRVHWQVKEGEKLIPDSTPEPDEDPISMEHKAWVIANRVAAAIPEAVNIHVTFGNGDPVAKGVNRILRPWAVPEVEPETEE